MLAVKLADLAHLWMRVAELLSWSCCWHADETPRRQSWLTKLWAGIVWMASGYQPTTYSYQKSLPRLPVPPLDQTIDRFLLSMQPLYGSDSEQFKKLRTSAQVW